MTRTPYADTSVPVVKSQAQIRALLRDAGALSVTFEDDWERGTVICRFGWQFTDEDGPTHRATVRLSARPLDPEPNRSRDGRKLSTWRYTAEQRDRQVWRGLYWYLKAMMDAVNFGLLRAEDVFLSFIESTPGGQTIGEFAIPRLVAQGRLEIEA